MFVIVDLTDERKRRFEKYRKHIIETKRCNVMGGAPFFVAKCHRQYFNRAELERIIKRCGAAIFKDGIIPDGFQKYSFTPSVLPLRMLVNSAAEFFKENPSAGRNMTVSIVDESAVSQKEVVALSQYVRFVRVITNRPDLYFSAELEAYNSFGAVLLVSKSVAAVKDSNLLIALNDEIFTPQEVKNAIVYSKKSYCENVFSAKESSFVLSEFEKETLGIDKFCFICALFETCGYKIQKIPTFCDAKSILYKTFT